MPSSHFDEPQNTPPRVGATQPLIDVGPHTPSALGSPGLSPFVVGLFGGTRY
jgi:hypothetical protein